MSWIVDVLNVEDGLISEATKESYYVAGDCVIGRDKTHEASFEEKGVSRNHGKLSLDSSGATNKLFYTDTKSTFGTFVISEDEEGGAGTVQGGDAVAPNKPMEVKDGTVMRLGKYKTTDHPRFWC